MGRVRGWWVGLGRWWTWGRIWLGRAWADQLGLRHGPGDGGMGWGKRMLVAWAGSRKGPGRWLGMGLGFTEDELGLLWAAGRLGWAWLSFAGGLGLGRFWTWGRIWLGRAWADQLGLRHGQGDGGLGWGKRMYIVGPGLARA
ncbi:hypothetical protein FNV43_RR20650 [Rhamnella rubrinervis]|uniref:Uncharacterized protein n=1 Tax=Rhamnella rubrinervis TaxID=2594499 RepID=A0A8K0E146_9ROSA|nr:hypothetical protein FNV43_RR20650 [Rhamnella rubrinervis]